MSTLLFIFSDMESESVNEKDKEAAKRDIQCAFGCFMEDFYGAWETGFSADVSHDVFGFEDPAAIILAAEQWNGTLRKQFVDTYETYMQNWGHTMSGTSEEGLDNQDLFRLRMAVSAMDNTFSPAIETIIYNQEDNVAYTVMDDKTLSYIRENPDLCVITNVSCC